MDRPERPADAGHDPARPEVGEPSSALRSLGLRPGVARGFVIAPRAARGVLGLAVLAGVALVGPPAGIGLTLTLLALGFAVAAAPAPAPGVDLRVAARAPGRDPWAPVWWALAGRAGLRSRPARGDVGRPPRPSRRPPRSPRSPSAGACGRC